MSHTYVETNTETLRHAMFAYTAVCNGTCQNGGTCLSPNANCSCPIGYSGEFCEQSTNEKNNFSTIPITILTTPYRVHPGDTGYSPCLAGTSDYTHPVHSGACCEEEEKTSQHEV